MEYSRIVVNEKGYQTAFRCAECGKYFDLEDLKYFGRDKRVCCHCLPKFQDKQKEEAKEIKVYLSGELSD